MSINIETSTQPHAMRWDRESFSKIGVILCRKLSHIDRMRGGLGESGYKKRTIRQYRKDRMPFGP